MDFYNNNWPTTKTMALYDQVEPLQQPIGFVHFNEKQKEEPTEAERGVF